MSHCLNILERDRRRAEAIAAGAVTHTEILSDESQANRRVLQDLAAYWVDSAILELGLVPTGRAEFTVTPVGGKVRLTCRRAVGVPRTAADLTHAALSARTLLTTNR